MALSKPIQDRYDKIRQSFPKILEKNFKHVTHSCREAGISRETFYRWYGEDEDFKKEIDDIQPYITEQVERHVFRHMQKDDNTALTAAIYYLNNKGKDLGYGKQPGETNQEAPKITDADLSALDRYITLKAEQLIKEMNGKETQSENTTETDSNDTNAIGA